MVAKVSSQVGVICSGQLPCNEWQSMYLSKSKAKADTVNPADVFYEVIVQAKQKEKGSKFIRALKVFPDLAIVLVTNRQILPISALTLAILV